MSLRPLHEVLFQLMCHRVPHQLKAQLTNTIAVFANSPDAAAELWERLKATAIFEVSQPRKANAPATLSRQTLLATNRAAMY
eukprot:scaffold680453_cov85-Prasinocladus_malaysianus.AAC.1